MKTDETRFNQIRCGKCNEIHLFLCVARDVGEGRGGLSFIFTFEIFLFMQ